MFIYTVTSHLLTTIYIGMMSIISMVMPRPIRSVNHTRTSIGTKNLLIRIRIIRICITGTGTSGGDEGRGER